MDKIKNKFSSENSIDTIKLKNYLPEELLKIYKETNNPDILSIIIEKFKKLVYKIAGEYRNKGIEYKDLLQLAFTGLVVAVNRFDVKKENKFSTFAVYCIRGEILHYIRDNNLIRYPRWLWKLNRLFNNFVKEFESKNNRYPTKEEISLGINVSLNGIDEILKAREAAFYRISFSEDEDSKDDGSYIYNKSLIKSRGYRSFELVIEDKILLWDAIDKLTGLRKKILISNYFLGYSQEEIGKKAGISQKSVSRHLNEAIKTLKKHMVEKTK